MVSFDQFFASGWQAFNLAHVDLSLILQSLTRSVGQVSMSSLQVKGTNEARANTLSHKHGAGEFPHHTDFAFRPVPPRAILLVNQTDTEFARPSHFSDLRGLEQGHRESLRQSLWELRGRNGTFVVGGEFSVYQLNGLRWDTDFLFPKNVAALDCVSVLQQELLSCQRTHVWRKQSALLLDNWRCSHARGEPPEGDDTGTRNLIRYEVWQHAGLDQ